MKHYNVDGDVLVYRAAWKAEKVISFDNELYTVVADLDEARGHYDHLLAEVVGEHPYTVVSRTRTGRTSATRSLKITSASGTQVPGSLWSTLTFGRS